MTTLIGVNTADTFTSAQLVEGKAFGVGDRHIDHDGFEWIFVLAGGAIPQSQVVTVLASCTAVNFSSAAVIGTTQAPFCYGISASASIASGSYGWIMTRGRAKARVIASSTGTLSGQLYAAPSAAGSGLVTVTASGSILLKGLYIIATATTSTTASAVPVVFRNIETST